MVAASPSAAIATGSPPRRGRHRATTLSALADAELRRAGAAQAEFHAPGALHRARRRHASGCTAAATARSRASPHRPPPNRAPPRWPGSQCLRFRRTYELWSSYLMRHGIAGRPDAGMTRRRPRAHRRKASARRRASPTACAKLGVMPDPSSPARCAAPKKRRAAGRRRSGTGRARSSCSRRSPPASPPEAIVKGLRPHRSAPASCCWSAINPDLGELASYLLTGAADLAPLPFKKAGVAAIAVDSLPPRSAGLLRLVPHSRPLRAIADEPQLVANCYGEFTAARRSAILHAADTRVRHCRSAAALAGTCHRSGGPETTAAPRRGRTLSFARRLEPTSSVRQSDRRASRMARQGNFSPIHIISSRQSAFRERTVLRQWGSLQEDCGRDEMGGETDDVVLPAQFWCGVGRPAERARKAADGRRAGGGHQRRAESRCRDGEERRAVALEAERWFASDEPQLRRSPSAPSATSWGSISTACARSSARGASASELPPPPLAGRPRPPSGPAADAAASRRSPAAV